jgi:hypothetical protein
LGKIFISYRRDDSEGQAGRLFGDLAAHFGEEAVFMDVAGIEPGRDFRRVIDEHVSTCGVLLAIIGKSWIDTKDETGRRRLEDPMDFVRLETATALKRDIPVVPVLVGGTRMPRQEQLPPDLEALAYRNGVELTHARWDSDVQVLIKSLSRYVESQRQQTDRANTGLLPTAPNKVEGLGTVRSGVSETVYTALGGTAEPPKKSLGMIIAGSIVAIVVAAGGYAWYPKSAQTTGGEKDPHDMAKSVEEKGRATDDAAWALAESAGTREAVQEYLKKTEQGGIPGIHLNEARQLLADLKRRAEDEANKASAAAKAEQDRLDKAERDRVAKAEGDRVAKAERDRAAKAEQDRAAKAEQDRIVKLERDRAAKAEQDRLDKAERDRAAAAKGGTPWYLK